MYKNFFKRVFDLLLALVALPFFLLIFIVVAPAIYIDDPGPVFYTSRRAGKNGKIFNMYKFRSMKVNAPDLRNADGSTFNSENDPRQTKIGKLLRKTSLDEIPQFLNILKGDMSLIGPRPVLESQLADFTEEERGKLKVLPGITGYTQAYNRNQLSNHEERMMDSWYGEHISLLLDIKIIFKTIDTVLHPSRVYRNAADASVPETEKAGEETKV